MRAFRRIVVDADLAKADPARQPLEEAVALWHLPQGRRRARREQAEVAGVFRDFLPRAPIDDLVKGMHGDAPRDRLGRAIRLGGIDDVIAVLEPVAHQYT